MAYDQGTPHASYEKAILSMNCWFKQGVPTSKLILGLAFYERNKEGGTRSYAQNIDAFAPPPSSDLAGGFHFNGIDTLTRKIRFTREKGFAGLMFLELSQDVRGENSALWILPLRKDFSRQKRTLTLA